jgi:hypothetical protein
MSLTQFKGPHIHSYKPVDRRSKINLISLKAEENR